MNFSEPFRVSSKLTHFSPNGKYLASVIQHKVIIREVKSLEVFQIHKCIDDVQKMEWASDSLFILCAMYKRAVVQIFSLEQLEWYCKLNLGNWGLVDVCWSPDARHILTISDFHLNIMVWSLLDKSVSYIRYCKQANPGMAFSPSGAYLAVAEKREEKDCISIFSCYIWKMIKNFECHTKNLAGLQWSPDSNLICVWDSLLYFDLFVYTLNGYRFASFSLHNECLGIRCVSWSPCSQFLAIGSYDHKVRILYHFTWVPFFEKLHVPSIIDTKWVVYEERILDMYGMEGGKQTFTIEYKYELVTKRPVILHSVKPELKASPKLGVNQIVFSPDGNFLATHCENIPNTVWIYDASEFEPKALLNHKMAVRYMCWDPTSSRLCICTGSSALYFWTPLGCVTVTVPKDKGFEVSLVRWQPEGNSLALLGKELVRFAFFNPDDSCMEVEEKEEPKKDSDSQDHMSASVNA